MRALVVDSSIPTAAEARPDGPPRGARRPWITALKIAATVGVLGWIGWNFAHQDNLGELRTRLAELSPTWIALAIALQAAAITFSIVRWGVMLRGQGLHVPTRHLVAAFMTGRFLSAASPGGWTGLDGWRIWDIGSRTKRPARAAAAVAVDKLLGQAAMGVVTITGASAFGARYVGTRGVFLIDLGFGAVIAMVLLVLGKPRLVRVLAERLPTKLRARAATTVQAVCAYDGKLGTLLRAFALSLGTHVCTASIYVGCALALGTRLSVGDIFFVATMTQLATLVPVSINGVGVREAASIRLYAAVHVAPAIALLIPVLYFVVDMLFSSLGGLFLLLPKRDVAIRIDDAEREERADEAIEFAPESEWPKLRAGTLLGLGAGLCAGVTAGLAEGGVILASSGGHAERSVLAYGAVFYGLLGGLGGAALGAALAWTGRLVRRRAAVPAWAFARELAFLVAACAFVLGAFRVRRDVFAEELVWKSGKGLGVLALCLLSSAVIYALLALATRLAVTTRVTSWVATSWGGALVAVAVAVATLGVTLAAPGASAAPGRAARAAPPADAHPIIVVVVDTVRADHLPLWGYAEGRTPNLDAFARDAIRFEHAYANAAWTRPSFATILTGSYVSRHATMAKSASLPDVLVTMPEALAAAGYETSGIVTNYNLAPFFHFDQGFDRYQYLEPDFVLGANDTAAKLLFLQAARQTLEKVDEWRAGGTPAGRAYRDASVVNRVASAELDRLTHGGASAWFLFVAYMDPHDPYYAHPAAGRGGYSRAAHPEPRADEAEHLTRLYDGEITYWDQYFGALIDDLRRRGVYDDATIVVTADHGEELFDHGGYWHGTTLYDEQLHVPLFVKLPRSEHGGSVRSDFVQHVDVMPTVLHLADVPAAPGVQGADVFATDFLRDATFAEESHEGNVLRSLRLRRGDEILKRIEANEGNPRGLAPVELYRLDLDPSEHVDLHDELPWESGLTANGISLLSHVAQRGAVHGETVHLGAEEQHALGALGYAGGQTHPNHSPP